MNPAYILDKHALKAAAPLALRLVPGRGTLGADGDSDMGSAPSDACSRGSMRALSVSLQQGFTQRFRRGGASR